MHKVKLYRSVYMYLITRQQPHPFISQPHGPYHLAQKRGKHHHHRHHPSPSSSPSATHTYMWLPRLPKRTKRQKNPTSSKKPPACVRAYRDSIILIGTKRKYMCLLHLSSKQYIRLVHTIHTYLLYISNTTMATPNNFLFSSRNKKKEIIPWVA